ncbi:ribosomal RNA small subunit methyltransferase A [bacterium]|nr:ribosomal RNA small subunit methyltransferase A [bacterium]
MQRQEVKALLARLGVKPSKGRGQNFLIEPEVVEDLLQFSQISADAELIEIGPGLGVLTEKLSKLVSTRQRKILTAIEVEPEFATNLRQRFGNLTVICDDVRNVNLPLTLDSAQAKYYLFGNLPYSLSSSILEWVVTQREYIEGAVFLLQREFVERISAQPGSRAYGSISVFLQRYAFLDAGSVVSPEVFVPAPKVDSQIVRLRMRAKPYPELKNEAVFERIVRAAFSARRKTLINSLMQSSFVRNANFATQQNTKATLQAALVEAQIDEQRRAETLSLDEFAQLADSIKRQGF